MRRAWRAFATGGPYFHMHMVELVSTASAASRGAARIPIFCEISCSLRAGTGFPIRILPIKAMMKHLTYKPEHAVDLDNTLIIAAPRC